MKELFPINQQVIIDITINKKEERTISGIILPDSAKDKLQMAKVIWMSTIENAEIATGDTVIFKPYSGTEIDFEGKKYLIIAYADILAKVVETEAI